MGFDSGIRQNAPFSAKNWTLYSLERSHLLTQLQIFFRPHTCLRNNFSLSTQDIFALSLDLIFNLSLTFPMYTESEGRMCAFTIRKEQATLQRVTEILAKAKTDSFKNGEQKC